MERLVEVAVRAKAFGMEILAYDPYLPADRIEADGARAVDLDTMLAESDMISIHLPVVEATKGIVNKDWFSKMKPTAIVINTARAAVIDQKDFVEALQNKTIEWGSSRCLLAGAGTGKSSTIVYEKCGMYSSYGRSYNRCR